jgi:hypothetical protein
VNNTPATESTLPIIQGLWYGSTVLGQMERLSIESFLQNGHPYHLYSYDAIANLPQGAVLKDAREIHPTPEAIKNRDGKVLGAAFSDVFRYKLLYDKGHYWADLDVICLKPFDFAEPVVMATELHRPHLKLDYKITDNPNIGINGNVMRFPAQSEEMMYCFEKSMNFDRAQLGFGEIGPELLTRCAEKFNIQRCAKPTETFNPVHYFDYRDLVDPRKRFAFSDRVYAVHLWSGAWGKNKLKHRVLNTLLRRPAQIKNNRFPDSTLYGQLLKRYLAQ